MRTITYCCADGNYTHVHLDNGSRLVISRTLGVLDELLSSPQFIRVHQTWLVQVDRISCLKPEQLVMDCGTVIPVSRSRRAEVRRLVILGACHWPASLSESQ
jgi:two-component system LytT family response regulator